VAGSYGESAGSNATECPSASGRGFVTPPWAAQDETKRDPTQRNTTQPRPEQPKGDATYSRTKRGKTTGDRKLELARLAAKALYGLTQLVDPPSELVLELLEGGEERFGMCTVGSVVIGRL
jgi:hypothetical protein